MVWTVLYDEDFCAELDKYPVEVQDEIDSLTGLLENFGPELDRPHVGKLQGSRVRNLKELRFTLNNQVWRVAFAFDPIRQAILLVGDTKQGVNQSKFYRKLIAIAESRYNSHLECLKNGNH